MKNIHVLPTEHTSRLFTDRYGNLKDHYTLSKMPLDSIGSNQNIYITSDEEIKEGDWCISLDTKTVFKVSKNDLGGIYNFRKIYHKIILTTDQDLIRDGVQAIDDEFLEWFVKNPSCEEVETFKVWWSDDSYSYEIVIPKEEPTIEEEYTSQDFLNEVYWNNSKQETLEEAAENYKLNTINVFGDYQSFIAGAKWKQEQMYSEEEVNLLHKSIIMNLDDVEAEGIINQLFEQFKKSDCQHQFARTGDSFDLTIYCKKCGTNYKNK